VTVNGYNASLGLRQDLLHYSDLVILNSSLKPGRFIGWRFMQGKPSQSHFRHSIIFTVTALTGFSLKSGNCHLS
jgi:hypothetical protein